MKVLITGAFGQLGHALFQAIPSSWNVLYTDYRHPPKDDFMFDLVADSFRLLDITDYEKVEDLIYDFQPDFVINAAAYTNVDRAESEYTLVHRINAHSVRNLAIVSQLADAHLIHLSTDYVFNGRYMGRYIEDDPPRPVNAYGSSKYTGEANAIYFHKTSFVIRTSSLYSRYGHNFLKTMLRLGLERDSLSVVYDNWSCPTHADRLAEMLVDVMTKDNLPPGIYHYSGDIVLSWFEFAQEIFKVAAKFDSRYEKLVLERISAAEYNAPAKRPIHVALSTRKIRQFTDCMPTGLDLDDIISKLADDSFFSS